MPSSVNAGPPSPACACCGTAARLTGLGQKVWGPVITLSLGSGDSSANALATRQHLLRRQQQPRLRHHSCFGSHSSWFGNARTYFGARRAVLARPGAVPALGAQHARGQLAAHGPRGRAVGGRCPAVLACAAPHPPPSHHTAHRHTSHQPRTQTQTTVCGVLMQGC